jgi:hypothetical protein
MRERQCRIELISEGRQHRAYHERYEQSKAESGNETDTDSPRPNQACESCSGRLSFPDGIQRRLHFPEHPEAVSIKVTRPMRVARIPEDFCEALATAVCSSWAV